MKTFKKYLCERRRNPSLNKVISNYKFLEKYKDDPNIYVTFTNIQKVGINPKSYYDTPNAIYSYNVKDTWHRHDHNNEKLMFEFGGKYSKFMYVFKSNVDPINLNKLSSSEARKYINRLRGAKGVPEDKEFDEFVQVNEMNYGNETAGYRFWMLVKILSGWNNKLISHMDLGRIHYSVRELQNDKYKKEFDILQVNVNGRKFANLLRDCNIKAVTDVGEGYIYSQEPYQTFFLSKSFIKIVDMADVRDKDYKW